MARKHKLTLIITGSIAAVKSYDLIHALQDKGIDVSIILTDAARQWITRDAAQLLTDQPVLDASDHAGLQNTLATGDVILAAPASADFIKQLAFADSPLAAAVRSSGKPLAIAPAMNVMMWQHPATQRNSRTLLADGAAFLGPVDGKMACGDKGHGRFMEPAIIADAVHSLLSGHPHPAFDAVNQALSDAPRLPAIANNPGKKILLLIQGGKDALATYSLISSLRSHGYDVTCAASDEALRFLPEEGLATMSNHRTYTRHYQEDIQGMEHIRLPEQADIVLIAPATAEGVKEMAQGGGKSFLGCLYLATKKPVALAPSCDSRQQPAAADLERLKQDGVNLLSVPKSLPIAGKARAQAIADALDTLMQHKTKDVPHVG